MPGLEKLRLRFEKRAPNERGAVGVIVGLFLAGGAALALVGLAIDGGGFLAARNQVQAESEQLARYLMQTCITNPTACANQPNVNTLAGQFLNRDQSPITAEPSVHSLCGRSPYLPGLPSCVEPYQLSEGCLTPQSSSPPVNYVRAVVTADAPSFFFRADGNSPGGSTNPVFGCYQVSYRVANSAPLYLPLAITSCRYLDSISSTGLSLVKLNRGFYRQNATPTDVPACTGHSNHEGVAVTGEVYPRNQFFPISTIRSSSTATPINLNCSSTPQIEVNWAGNELLDADTVCSQALANSPIIKNLGSRFLFPIVTRPNRTKYPADAQYFNSSGQATSDFVVRGFAHVSIVAYKFRLQTGSLAGFTPPGGWLSNGCDNNSYCMYLRFHEGVPPDTGIGGGTGINYGSASLTPLP